MSITQDISHIPQEHGKEIVQRKEKMTKDIIVSGNALIPSEQEMMVYHSIADQALQSKLYKDIGDSASALAKMLTGRELGIPPMASLREINIFQGKVEISARMMSALIRSKGHSIQEKLSSMEECILVGQRGDTRDTMTISFNIEEARQAGLIREGGNWKKYPKDMLFARALSRLARRLFSDVIGGCYVEGEIKDTNYEVIEPIPVVNEDKLLTDFLSKIPEEHYVDWQMYIDEIKEQFQISLTKIIERYNKDPNAAQEKFKAWKANKTL